MEHNKDNECSGIFVNCRGQDTPSQPSKMDRLIDFFPIIGFVLGFIAVVCSVISLAAVVAWAWM